ALESNGEPILIPFPKYLVHIEGLRGGAIARIPDPINTVFPSESLLRSILSLLLNLSIFEPHLAMIGAVFVFGRDAVTLALKFLPHQICTHGLSFFWTLLVCSVSGN